MNKTNIKNNYQDKKNSDLYWDSNIKEYEIDPSWQKHEVYKSKNIKNIGKNGQKQKKGNILVIFLLILKWSQPTTVI